MEWLKISETREISTKLMNKKLIYGLVAIAAIIITATVVIMLLNPPPDEINNGGGSP